MFERLEAIKERNDAITKELTKPEVISDVKKVTKLSKEQSDLSEIIECYDAYLKAKNDYEEAKELARDPEMKEFAMEEEEKNLNKQKELEKQLEILLLPKDPNDDKNVFVEIRGGAGGDEAALFAYDMYRMFTRYAERQKWKVEVMELNEIGVGAVAAGGIISLIKSLPLIVRTFKQALKGYGKKADGVESRLTKDIPMMFVVLGIGVLAIIMWLIPAIPVNLLSAIIIIIFGFFFATVSSRMVGLVGSSNNPVSGMAIATLLISSAILKATGTVGMKGMVAAISIGSVICIIAAIAGDTSQDLKTGYIVGATPYKQQAGELIGVAVSAITVGGVLYLLNAAWGYGSTELPAPQATLMKMVVEGVMGNSLPWSLVFAGVAIAIVVEILQIPVLPFAVGLYLPIYLSTPIMVGGLVRLYFDKKKGITEEERKAKVNQGILYSSGLIAGEGLVGILLAVFAIIPVGADTLGDAINISKIINLGNIGGLVFFACLVATLVAFINKKEKKTK